MVIAAVSVVLPWSTCPIVPTLTCGLLTLEFFFGHDVFSAGSKIGQSRSARSRRARERAPDHTGAHARNRTGDLTLTKGVLYQLSYMGRKLAIAGHNLERVMGIEPTPSAWKAEVLPLNYTRCDRPGHRTGAMRPRRNPTHSAHRASRSRCQHAASEWVLVEGGGFEPPKAEPSDLQSDPFDRSGTPPNERRIVESPPEGRQHQT